MAVLSIVDVVFGPFKYQKLCAWFMILSRDDTLSGGCDIPSPQNYQTVTVVTRGTSIFFYSATKDLATGDPEDGARSRDCGNLIWQCDSVGA